MSGRARLSPYYFVSGEKTELAGILATICPADKKVIHGMKDAVMVPCAVAETMSMLSDECSVVIAQTRIAIQHSALRIQHYGVNSLSRRLVSRL